MTGSNTNPYIPMRAVLEDRLQANVIVFDDGGVERPGGMYRCCGCGPNAAPDFQAEPWYIYRANLCDSDGVFYSMACEECLEDLRYQHSQRPKTGRDEMGDIVSDLMGDDIDGAQTMMDDLDGFDLA